MVLAGIFIGFQARPYLWPPQVVTHVRYTHYNPNSFLWYADAYNPLVTNGMKGTPHLTKLPSDCRLLRKALASGVPYYTAADQPAFDRKSEELYVVTYLLVNGSVCAPPPKHPLSERQLRGLITTGNGIIWSMS